MWHSRSMHTPRVPAYLQGRHAGHPGVYAYTCTTVTAASVEPHTQNGPRERWPHLCMHSRNALLPGISTCRPAEHYSILLCMQREHVALLVTVRHHASSIVPGGVRCQIRMESLTSCVEILGATSARADVLATSIMLHRV